MIDPLELGIIRFQDAAADCDLLPQLEGDLIRVALLGLIRYAQLEGGRYDPAIDAVTYAELIKQFDSMLCDIEKTQPELEQLGKEVGISFMEDE